jgi:hypothetical protein
MSLKLFKNINLKQVIIKKQTHTYLWIRINFFPAKYQIMLTQWRKMMGVFWFWNIYSVNIIWYFAGKIMISNKKIDSNSQTMIIIESSRY